MWVPEGTEIEKASLGEINPTEVLFEFEQPLTFVCRDRDGQLMLAHSLSDEGGLSRYLVVVTDSRILEDLKAGRLDLLASLRQPRAWVADVGRGWEVMRLWLIPFDKLPKDILPRPGAMVTPELDPLLRLKLVGTGVGPGKTSAADVRMAAQAAESGLRGLARVALDEKKKVGQVSKDVRHYSDLPYQYSRVASFEIAFGRPRDTFPSVDDEVFHEMGSLLDRGLKALRANGDDLAPVEGLDAEQTLQLFEAIKSLTPPTRGGVDRIEVGGTLADDLSGTKVLTRDDRSRSVQRIKASRRAPRKEAPFRIMGIIEEADQGTSSFTLRQLDPPNVPVVGMVSEIRFQFEDHLYDIVMEAFNSLERMVVVGERINNVYQALDVQLASDTVSDASTTMEPGPE
jgi:hypothetical protein